jgi:hypothetical protein
MNINPNEYFLANDNLEMLWELLTEESSFKNKSPNNRQNIYDVFCNNLVSFNDVEKQKGVNLMNMNKKYVMSMISYINKMDTDELQKNTLINSYNKSSSNVGGSDCSSGQGILKKNSQKYTPVTAEDIQNNRKMLFEEELVKHQKDFDDVIKKHVPEEPNFKIDMDDGPIKEMDKKIKEITEQRNYELQQINNSYGNNNVPTITSNNTHNNANNNNTTPIPISKPNDSKVYIQIDNKDIMMANEDINIINLDQIAVSPVGNTNSTNTNTTNNDMIGLFNKLKKVDNTPSSTTTPKTEEWNNINGKIDTMRNDITSINDKIELLYNMITKIVSKDTATSPDTATSTDTSTATDIDKDTSSDTATDIDKDIP